MHASRRHTQINQALPPGPGFRSALVTGAAGYVGSHLVNLLVSAGVNVLAADWDSRRLAVVSSCWPDDQVSPILCDLRYKDHARDLISGVDVVFHLAGIVGAKACRSGAESARSINVDLTRQLHRQTMETSNAHFIFASTCSVYGDTDGQMLTETAQVCPADIYAEMKAESEDDIRRNGPPGRSAIIRFGTLFGSSPIYRTDLVANAMCVSAVRDGRVYVSGPERWRPFVTSRDAASMLICTSAILSKASPPVHTSAALLVNGVVTDNNVTLQNLAERICELRPGTTLSRSRLDGDNRSYRVSGDLLKQLVGDCASTPLNHGLQAMLTDLTSGRVRSVSPRSPANFNVEKRADGHCK